MSKPDAFQAKKQRRDRAAIRPSAVGAGPDPQDTLEDAIMATIILRSRYRAIMNPNRSDDPRDHLEPQVDGASSGRGEADPPAKAIPDPSPAEATSGEHAEPGRPIVAKLADPSDPAPHRVGSPFAPDASITVRPRQTPEDFGSIRYVASGAVAASILVLGFAVAAVSWFPAGGALIAALGCVLAILGLYSSFRLASATLLAVHLCLFVVSYGRSLG